MRKFSELNNLQLILYYCCLEQPRWWVQGAQPPALNQVGVWGALKASKRDPGAEPLKAITFWPFIIILNRF